MSETSNLEALRAILEQAIKFEDASYMLYSSAAKIVKSQEAKLGLQDLAKEEIGHKERLQALASGDVGWRIRRGLKINVNDYKLGDHLVARPLTAESDLQDALVVAIQREKSTHEFYAAMAGAVTDAPVKELFELLSKEELKHKNKVESLYESLYYKEF